MAYITKDKVKNIRMELKKEFPNFKFSVTGSNSSEVRIIILESDVDFFGDYGCEDSCDYISVNQYYIDSQWKNKSKDVLNKILKIARSQGWYDNSDIMIDYFETAYYVGISIGDWDKPYKLK